jgi:predicted RNA-binding Zn ribbon-like protein
MQEAVQSLRMPPRIGGSAALDFTNTAEYRGRENYMDMLRSYGHLLSWAWRTEVLPEDMLERLYDMACNAPDEAEEALARAAGTREIIYQVFSILTDEGRQPTQAELADFNVALRGLPPRQMESSKERPQWTWAFSPLTLDAPLWPVLLDAGNLLASDAARRVRKCPNCGWLFVDKSRNHSRRWCSMEFCGSQVKSRRQYERKKEAIER